MRPARHAPDRKPIPATGMLAACLLAALGLPASCVTEDAQTGRPIPRGEQKYPFDEVQEKAEQLQPGLNKTQVLMLLGSPAEKDEKGDVWIYLPERYAVLVPARALRLEFRDRILVEYGYRPIVLGAQF